MSDTTGMANAADLPFGDRVSNPSTGQHISAIRSKTQIWCSPLHVSDQTIPAAIDALQHGYLLFASSRRSSVPLEQAGKPAQATAIDNSVIAPTVSHRTNRKESRFEHRDVGLRPLSEMCSRCALPIGLIASSRARQLPLFVITLDALGSSTDRICRSMPRGSECRLRLNRLKIGCCSPMTF